MRSGFRRTAALLICFSSWSPVSVAQYLDVVPVSGTGSAEIRKPADRLRAVIPLSGRGENVRKAAAALKDREDAAKIQLLTLGAKKDSIRLGELSIDNGVSDTHQRMLLQLRGALPNRSGGEADDMKQMIVVRRYLSAEWPLKGDGVELLARAEEVRRQVLGTEFNDAADEEELSEEEQELMEEARMFGESDQEDPNKPAVFFVASVSDDEQKKIAADAFRKAKEAADVLAAAAGRKLGRLLSVAESHDAEGDWNQYEMQRQFGEVQYRMMYEDAAARDEQRTIRSITPMSLTFDYAVTVGYEFEE